MSTIIDGHDPIEVRMDQYAVRKTASTLTLMTIPKDFVGADEYGVQVAGSGIAILLTAQQMDDLRDLIERARPTGTKTVPAALYDSLVDLFFAALKFSKSNTSVDPNALLLDGRIKSVSDEYKRTKR